ncbi:MAG: hypothetical protein EZS28_036302 [Streblomastix strix]|uniref:Reverse transcriptase domain-containing protein n=1 Tax=Streblomastix strix TaxID=222440 RepID=A0A5J4UE34_9EUKA|nr:MAG: hypothetical protein EZS28_036302 [Streblomastix strix]
MNKDKPSNQIQQLGTPTQKQNHRSGAKQRNDDFINTNIVTPDVQGIVAQLTGQEDKAEEEEDEQTDEAAVIQNKNYRVSIISQPPLNGKRQFRPCSSWSTGEAQVKEKGSKKSKTEGLNASDEPSQSSNAQAKTKSASKVLKHKVTSKKSTKKLKQVKLELKKTLTMRVKRSVAPDRAGTLQPREISVEISSGTEKRSALMKTAPQEMVERIGELIYKEKENGMGGKTKRFIQTWKQIGKEDFINTGFYLIFKDQNNQQRLEENKMIIPFRGTKEEKEAYQEMLREELEEGKLMPIQQDQVKWWNNTFLIKKPNGTWRKILDTNKLNKEIEKLHFKMYRLEDVQYLANKMDYTTSIDLKSAFHHISVSPNSIPYLAFNFKNNYYAYNAMPFGTKRSPIFFAEAIESILKQI